MKRFTVFSFSGVALHHLVTSFKAGEGHVCDRVLLVVRFLGRDNGCEGGKREVNAGEPDIRRDERRNFAFLATYGTKLVWNSFKSTFKEPSNRKDAVIEETTWAMSLFRFVKLGEAILRFFLHMS
jgi:hypothetical protein